MNIKTGAKVYLMVAATAAIIGSVVQGCTSADEEKHLNKPPPPVPTVTVTVTPSPDVIRVAAPLPAVCVTLIKDLSHLSDNDEYVTGQIGQLSLAMQHLASAKFEGTPGDINLLVSKIIAYENKIGTASIDSIQIQTNIKADLARCKGAIK